MIQGEGFGFPDLGDVLQPAEALLVKGHAQTTPGQGHQGNQDRNWRHLGYEGKCGIRFLLMGEEHDAESREDELRTVSASLGVEARLKSNRDVFKFYE
ncbi:hypothetical protein NDU88_000910 [Pleurodeles waltl]|uniref:Uncharacterized protein n=1 Tax=Pleurodeles waltl TaxID=8319 RepID=A0AAV7VA83_PLEWA|nr:hypothetical protein NDU88_000910 [Pleurodeles waltl]